MKRPPAEALSFAAQWMASYEPAPGDAENARHAEVVSAWLLEQENDEMLRVACKEAGVSVADVRRQQKRHAEVARRTLARGGAS